MGWLSKLRFKKRGKVHIIEGPPITKKKSKLRLKFENSRKNKGKVRITSVKTRNLPPLGEINSLRGKRENFENFRKFAEQKYRKSGLEASAVGLLIKEGKGEYRILKLENLIQVEKSSGIGIRHDHTILDKIEKMEKEIKKQNPDAEIRVLNVHSHPPDVALSPSRTDLKRGMQEIGLLYDMGRPVMGIMNPLTGEIKFYEGERKIPFKDK